MTTCPHGSLRRSCEACELVAALQEACGLALEHGRLLEEARDLVAEALDGIGGSSWCTACGSEPGTNPDCGCCAWLTKAKEMLHERKRPAETGARP